MYICIHTFYNHTTELVNFMFCWPASWYNCVKKNHLDAHIILSIFRQPLHVSGLSRPIIRRYNRMYTTIGTYSFYMNVCYPGWIEQYFLKFAIRRALHNSQWKVILLSVPRHWNWGSNSWRLRSVSYISSHHKMLRYWIWSPRIWGYYLTTVCLLVYILSSSVNFIFV